MKNVKAKEACERSLVDYQHKKIYQYRALQDVPKLAIHLPPLPYRASSYNLPALQFVLIARCERGYDTGVLGREFGEFGIPVQNDRFDVRVGDDQEDIDLHSFHPVMLAGGCAFGQRVCSELIVVSN
jgi:hypothetical protein